MLPEVHDAHAPHRLAPSSTVCRCGKECLGCRAAALSVTCGCEFEAKQFEYRLDDVAAGHDHHAAHGVAPIREGGSGRARRARGSWGHDGRPAHGGGYGGRHASPLLVATNAVLLKRVEGRLDEV